jgi:hypothetical protein
MQNKPNLLDAQMNVTSVRTMNYEQTTMNNANENKPNLSRRSVLAAAKCFTKPDQAQFSNWRENSLTACWKSLE